MASSMLNSKGNSFLSNSLKIFGPISKASSAPSIVISFMCSSFASKLTKREKINLDSNEYIENILEVIKDKNL